MTIMHMTLAELANSDPEMRLKDREPAAIPVWYCNGWIEGKSVITVHFSDGAIKHMTYNEAWKLGIL